MFNAGSLESKIGELSHLVSFSHIDLTSAINTYPHNELQDQEVSHPGYVLFRQDRPTNIRNRGAAL